MGSPFNHGYSFNETTLPLFSLEIVGNQSTVSRVVNEAIKVELGSDWDEDRTPNIQGFLSDEWKGNRT